MNNKLLDPIFLKKLKKIYSSNTLLTDPNSCWAYGSDNSRRHALADAVCFATQETQVQDTVLLCNDYHIAITTRGRATGTTGAAVPSTGGLVLSLERFKSNLTIDAANRIAVVSPGVTNQELQDAAAKQGFFWPPDPTSAAFCTIGGNLAYNSAGPRAVKYGTPRENTLGLRAITGAGELLKTGGHTTKNVVGYDLTRLLIGSEGSLAITTEAILKLTPLPAQKRLLQAIYSDIHAAANAVAEIMAQPLIPYSLEFIDGQAINMIRDYSKTDLPRDAGAMLLIEVDGEADFIDHAVKQISNAASNMGLLSITHADSAEKSQALWETRKALSPALRKIAPKKINEDVVVPVSNIPALIQALENLSKKFNITIVNFGHAGNGNIHVNLLIDPDDPKQKHNAELCLAEVFSKVIELNGSLSGEHGIGLEKKPFLGYQLDAIAIELMRKLKTVFDPNLILNPDKTP